jgi:hypothetical protein
MKPLAAEFLGEGRLELLVREAARAGADLAVDGEGTCGDLAHHRRGDEAQVAGDGRRFGLDPLPVCDDDR